MSREQLQVKCGEIWNSYPREDAAMFNLLMHARFYSTEVAQVDFTLADALL